MFDEEMNVRRERKQQRSTVIELIAMCRSSLRTRNMDGLMEFRTHEKLLVTPDSHSGVFLLRVVGQGLDARISPLWV